MADVVLVELTCKQKVVVSVHEDHAEQVGVDIVDEVQLVGPDIDTVYKTTLASGESRNYSLLGSSFSRQTLL